MEKLIRKYICGGFNCSDGNDNQYPFCELFKTNYVHIDCAVKRLEILEFIKDIKEEK